MLRQLFIQISIQPQQRGLRFRYLCEGQAHGPILGEGGSKENKVFPTVELHNCPPHANVYLHVSLCAEDSEQVHMHNLHGRNVFNGEYFEQLQASGTGYLKHSLQGISILQTKNDIRNDILGCKIAQKSLLDQKGIVEYIKLMKEWSQQNVEFDTSCFKSYIPNLESYITLAAGICVANNAVRLQYQAFVFNNDCQFVPLKIFSRPVFDNKAPSRAILKIHKISRVCGSSNGGEDVFLLCDKIEKGDIEVIFYTEDAEGRKTLLGKGQFSPADVWHQYAIVFKTPCCSYEHVEAKICLRRKKNPNDMSNSITFTFISQFSFPPYFPQDPFMDTSTMINSSPYPDPSQSDSSFREPQLPILSETSNAQPDYHLNPTLSHYQRPNFQHGVYTHPNSSIFDTPPSHPIIRQNSPSLFQQPSPQNQYPDIRGSNY